jgi:hypothetical protein
LLDNVLNLTCCIDIENCVLIDYNIRLFNIDLIENFEPIANQVFFSLLIEDC